MIEKKELLNIASLAKLKLSEEDEEKITKKFNLVLNYARMFDELDLENVEPLVNINNLSNVMREDEPMESYDRETLLANAPEKLYGCIKVSKIIE
ncbi:MAG: Asp-tRNA(Asn)/Glu-tRNA(Gln) amidotransferase subunit GatC [Clostridiales bacterium]|jgi:aspartyl-tRNA(Asn)/glutamyl-tRNA(Gln) amidotransferase subunit C|nr:Asp-tRNA(Asn)/Glu-tRNA(Gln) amidotransferase subunit GatC [Clostridiales bacterium]